MAAAMFQNPTERLRGTALGMLVWGRTINWIGEACELGRPAQHVIRFEVRGYSARNDVVLVPES
jgi:hypothetical protein